MHKKNLAILLITFLIASCGSQSSEKTAKLDKLELSNLSFSAQLGETKSQTISFENSGNADLSYTAVVEGDFLQLNPLEGTVAPSEQATLTLRASCPSSVTTLEGSFTLSSNGGNKEIPVTLSCAALPTTGLKLSVTGLPESVNASISVSNSQGFNETLENSQTLELTAGTYNVKANSVKVGAVTYRSSLDEVVTVSQDSILSLSAVYAATKGSLNLSISGLASDLKAQVVVSNAQGFSQTIEASQLLDLDIGEYRVEAKDVKASSLNYTSSTNELINISQDQSTSLDISYSTIKGSIEVQVSGFLLSSHKANIEVKSTDGSVRETITKSGTIDLPPGDYTVTPLTATPDVATFEPGSSTAVSVSVAVDTVSSLDDINYSCVSVNPSAKLDQIFRALFTAQSISIGANYNCADLAKLTGRLSASTQNLSSSDIDGIQYLDNINEFYFYRNNILTLSETIFERLTVLEEINFQDNNIIQLPKDLFKHTVSLSEISFQGNNLTSLPLGIFDNMTLLSRLNLGLNKLSSLPTGIFDELILLNDLSLGNNTLTSLDPSIFNNLTVLTRLALFHNKFTSLPSGLFDNLNNLNNLNLDNNKLSSVPTGIFDSLTLLEELTLSNNKLTSLPVDSFSKLTQLSELELDRNNLTSLPLGIFDALSLLDKLELNNNNLSSLPLGMFDNLDLLDNLNLSNNNLSSLPAGIFDELTLLGTLNLSTNDLSTIPVGVFDELRVLETLFLTRSGISSLPAGVFDNLTTLDNLYMEYANLTDLPANLFDNLSSLKRLELSNNLLSDITSLANSALPSLATLDLGRNCLQLETSPTKEQLIQLKGRISKVTDSGNPNTSGGC